MQVYAPANRAWFCATRAHFFLYYYEKYCSMEDRICQRCVFFFPDEAQGKAQAVVRDHVTGRIQLKAPGLLSYELSNALRQAERRKRISPDKIEEILEAMKGLQIELIPLEIGEMLPLSRRFDCSAYDAAYLTLAERLDEEFITGDERLFNAVRKDLDWVVWIENYN
jgi:predicted nucleic acid-binding protein